jgi:hypothetical protein
MLIHHKVRGVSDESRTRAIAAGLAIGRAAIGAAVWLAPERALETLGFDVRRRRSSGPAVAMARLAATRDLLLAAEGLRALSDPVRLRRIALAGAAADAGDSVAFALALACRDGIDRAAIRGLLAAILAAAVGVWLATRCGWPKYSRGTLMETLNGAGRRFSDRGVI